MITERLSPRFSAMGGEPQGWWGAIWSAPRRRSLLELVSESVVDPPTAALLWTLVDQGRSLTVAAGPSGSGKTTLLTSLLDAIPPSRRRRYVGGIHERFHDLHALPARETALLVNEVSPHLPAYCWGTALRRLLETGSAGYQVLATIHAKTPAEIVSSLMADPLRLPPRSIAALGTVVFLDVREAGDTVVRRVRSVVRMWHDDSTNSIALSEFESGDVTGVLRLAGELEIDPSHVVRRAGVIAGMLSLGRLGRDDCAQALRGES